MILDHLTDIARDFELLARAIVVICAFRWKATPQFRWSPWFIAAELLRSCILFGFDPHTLLYADIWSISQPVLWILQSGAVIELVLLAFKQKESSGSAIRHIFVCCIPFAVLVSVVISLFEPLEKVAEPWWLLTAITTTKWLAFVCLFLPLAQELLDLTNTRPLQRELVIHRRLLIVYVGLTPGLMAILALLQDRHVADIANFCSEISLILCLAFWTAFFRLSGLRQTATCPVAHNAVRA